MWWLMLWFALGAGQVDARVTFVGTFAERIDCDLARELVVRTDPRVRAVCVHVPAPRGVF